MRNNRYQKWVFLKSGLVARCLVLLVAMLIINGRASSALDKKYVQGVTQHTPYGQVKGTRDESTDNLVWRGIRYAKAPVGNLRWRAPQEPESWSGVKETIENGPVCTQLSPFTGKVTGDEDCLLLNIYRPNSTEAGLPVYVWIHGGANETGEAPDLNYFAKEAGLVVVAIQYRMGPLGFFNHEALKTGDPQEDSGNFGILDQMMALQWVKNSITGFGGNPDNVTVAGESAGAHDIYALLTIERSNGLYQKTVIQSGGMDLIELDQAQKQSNAYVEQLTLTLKRKLAGKIKSSKKKITKQQKKVEKARSKGGSALKKVQKKLQKEEKKLALLQKEYDKNAKLAKVAEKMGVELAGELRTIDAERLLKNKPSGAWFGVIVDGSLIKGNLFSLIKQGRYNKVPILMGGNRNEFSAWLLWYGGPEEKWSSLWQILPKGGNKEVSEILNETEQKTFALVSSLTGRLWQAQKIHSVARSMRQYQDDVYVYDFQWGGTKGSKVDFVLGASHANEIGFFHSGGDWDWMGQGTSLTEENKAARQALAKAMLTYQAQFALLGTPNGPADLPEWKVWSNEKDSVKAMNLNASSEPGSAELKLFMTKHEYREEDLNRELEESNDPIAQKYYGIYRPILYR